MQRKYLLRAALVFLLIAGSYLVLWSSSKSQKSNTCTESMEDCCQKGKSSDASGEMIWETLSHQFFSYSGISE